MWGAWIIAVGFFWLARPDPMSLRTGGAIVLAGLLIRGWAAGVLEKDRELAVSGPYAFTRNPLYLGSFVMGMGAVVAGGRLWIGAVFLVFFVSAYWRTMARESGDLKARFGEQYHHYRDSVPTFVPRVVPYRPPPGFKLEATSFSMARYVRNREYEAALGALAGVGLLALKAAGWPG